MKATPRVIVAATIAWIGLVLVRPVAADHVAIGGGIVFGGSHWQVGIGTGGIGIGIGIGGGCVPAPAPVVYAPVVAPAPVVYAPVVVPQPVVVLHRVVVPQPVVVMPQPVVVHRPVVYCPPAPIHGGYPHGLPPRACGAVVVGGPHHRPVW